MTAIINQPAPQPQIECWCQGFEPPLDELAGQVILINVIQVNCTGCFVHSLPEVIRLHEEYKEQGLKVFAIATAFEHFEHNTLNNLERLLQRHELQGEPLAQLSRAGLLTNGRLPYEIPFSVAMDRLVKNSHQPTKEGIEQFILSQIPDFHDSGLDDKRKQAIFQQAEAYLEAKRYNALTFEQYNLQGTPSSILIDKQGILRQVTFGMMNELEDKIGQLLRE